MYEPDCLGKMTQFILMIMTQYDPTVDPKLTVGHNDLFLWSSHFALYLENYIMYKNDSWDNDSSSQAYSRSQ